MIAYKLFRVYKNGTVHSLFINKKESLPLKKWLHFRSIPTKGFAVRPGWHSTSKPVAPHLSMTNREWFLVEIQDFKTLIRPKSQGGKWYISKKIRILKKLLTPAMNVI